MIKEKIKKIFDYIQIKDCENNKKKIENLVFFLIILVITIIIINTIWNEDNKKESKEEIDTGKILAKSDNDGTIDNKYQNMSTDLEDKLKNILAKIDGVGKVDVLITYSESSKITAMYNEDNTKNDTEENDTQGGNRKVTQTSTKKEVIYTEVNGKKVPVTQSVINPKIEGAIIIADRSK